MTKTKIFIGYKRSFFLVLFSKIEIFINLLFVDDVVVVFNIYIYIYIF